MLSLLRNKLPKIEPVDLTVDEPADGRCDAAVLAAFTSSKDEPQIVLTQRSLIMRSHAGEVAFPGGKVDEVDTTLVDTALRESNEEIGLRREDVELIGQIDSFQSRKGVSVQPYVGIISDDLLFQPESIELDSVFKAPVSLFYDERSVIMHGFQMEKMWIEVPGFKFGQYTIWGLTASMIVSILNKVSEQKIVLPDIIYKPLK